MSAPVPTATLKFDLRTDGGFQLIGEKRLTIDQWIAFSSILEGAHPLPMIAAPDLLAALQVIERICGGAANNTIEAEIAACARKAIAKARGEI
ncbi:MAG TPA: hypothetical protein VF614_15095 [Chthoniobacteraceae bacterium]